MTRTRERSPVTPPVVLTVAGSDSGGGAGIQADLKTIEAGGAFGTSAITSVTAQHTRGVESTHVLPVAEVDAQCEAVFSDFEVAAVKTGMLATTELVELVTDRVAATDAPAVVDPVMIAASGDRLLDSEAESAYEELIAQSTLVTPNADEAAVLTGIEVGDTESAVAAGESLVEGGATAALVKGGHVPGPEITDVLVTESEVERIIHPRVETDATHGSGCTLSSAIATRLAHGEELSVAVRSGVRLLERAVRYGLDVGQGPGAVHHTVTLRERAEREPTAEQVAGVVRRLVDADVSQLVPEVGMNVVGATPYAESTEECAAVEGRITRTLDGVNPSRGVRFGASSHVASFLLAAREHEPAYRFAVNCRLDDSVADALDELEWPTGGTDRHDRPEEVQKRAAHSAEERAAQTRELLVSVFEKRASPPVAVSDAGAVGVEPMVTLLARDADALVDRTLALQQNIRN